MVLWEISSRKMPFSETEDEQLVISWIMKWEKEDIPEDCPSEFSVLIQQCWEVPEKRPSAENIVISLKKFKPGSSPAVVSNDKKYIEKSWYFNHKLNEKQL